MENKNMILIVISLIIGASGLGLGAYSIITLQTIESVQGPPGEDGIDGIDGINGTNGIDGADAPGFYCNSATEVQQALDSIGNGFGKIVINESIKLTSKINVSGGGSYSIQGQNPGITINCSGDWSAFDITNATSCIIKDLKIDSSDVILSSREIINIEEINNNPINIEDIQIIGDSDLTGYGIYIKSGNVRISDCYITNVRGGIYQASGNYCYISGNILDRGSQPGIRISGSFNMITNNFIKNYDYGISITGNNNSINDNNLIALQFNGITLFNCDYNIISRNYISNIGSTGIYMDACNFVLISDNQISKFGANGINLNDGKSNVLSGNQIFYGKDDGIIINNGDYNLIIGNLIYNNSRTDSVSFAAIQVFNDSDFNTISSNGIFNCTSSGGTAYGISITGANCDENTVIGNTSLFNDDNWQNSGTNTFGDDTNNNFN